MKGIYAYWDNKLSQYVYIGKDSYIDKNERHKDHLSPSKCDVQPFNRVIQNNPERYEYRILMEGNYNEKQLNKMERFCIKHLKTYHYDYPERHVFNFTRGGDGCTGLKHSEETKKKISKNHARFWEGKTRPEETGKKISESKKGKYLGEDNPNYGNPSNYIHSDECKLKMSKARNTTSYFRVSKHKDKTCKQGFVWEYRYYEEGKTKYVTSVSIEKLEEKVKTKGLLWKKIEGNTNDR